MPEGQVTHTAIVHARSLLSSNVKTMHLKEIKTDVHTHAMTSNDVMVGVFQDGLHKHCVRSIDVSNGVGSSVTQRPASGRDLFDQTDVKSFVSPHFVTCS